MARLSDSQLVILSAAAKRDKYAVLPLPKSLMLDRGAIAAELQSLLAARLIEERPATRGDPAWRDEDGRRVGFAITAAGLKALGIAPNSQAPKRTRVGTERPNAEPAMGSKAGSILKLLGRARGVSIEELQTSTGWQAHSVRGMLSGLRKKGVAVVLTKHEGKPSTYNISGKA
jgi:hypothetical protein